MSKKIFLPIRSWSTFGEKQLKVKLGVPKIKIIFENQFVVVIDKPAGIMSHSDGRKEEYTLADWLKDFVEQKFSKKTWQSILKNVGEEGREGIVHRLDTGTTGVMILALNLDSFNFLKKQFHNHNLKKIYQAIIVGHLKDTTGIIDAPIARSKSDFRKKNVKDLFEKDGQGNISGPERSAVTRYKVLAKLKSKSGQPFTLVECYPETGRTHQIRVHFRSIRHPILGDELYGVKFTEKENLEKDFSIKIVRPMLHATSLQIKILENNLETDKIYSVEKIFSAHIPNDMRTVLAELE